MASGKRDHLVETALDLFYKAGFHATGIDKILETAGVARMTLYNHFKSKDELIVAALRRRDEKFRYWFMRAVERFANKPQDRLLAIFDALEEWFTGDEFSGCMFINASAEFADAEDPIHMVAAEHKHFILRYLQDLAAETGVAEPEELANELMLLMEGSIVMAYVAGDQQTAARARRAAQKLLSAALNGPS
jgi:AcrR family transcriptional regulator